MKTEVETNRNSTVLKELLAEEVGSNFYSAFRQADVKRSGYLTVDDMARILGKFSITLTDAELDCLLRKYDSNRDGRVSYLEFLTQLMPEGRVDSLKTPAASPARPRITASPSVSARSPIASRATPSKRDSSRQQLSFDNVQDEDDNQLVPFSSSPARVRSPGNFSLNQSMNQLALNDSVNRSRTANRSLGASPSRGALTQVHTSEIKKELDSEFESMRQRLALHPSYTLLNAFKHLDSSGRGYISIAELRSCLTDAGYYCTPDELELCVKLFDTNGDGRISYAEFISKMMPTEAVYSELVASPSAGGIRAERRLSIPAQMDLAKALKQRIEQEKQVDQLNRSQMYSWSE